MNNPHANQIFKDVSQEHNRLNRSVNDLIAFWQEVNDMGRGPKWAEMGCRIREFRRLLADHFMKEEEYFSLLEKSGELEVHEKIEHFRNQHTRLLNRLARDIEDLEQEHQAMPHWSDIMQEFDELIDCLVDHEDNELPLWEKFQSN